MAVEIARLFVSIGAKVDDLVSGLAKSESRLQSFGSKATQLGLGLSAAVTTPLTMIGKSALDAAVDFEGGMNMIQAVSGATSAEMERMRSLANELGADLSLPGTSAADAASAMVELAKAGLSVNDTMAAAKGVLQLSAAGALSNAEAAEIASNALNAFSLAGSEANRVADIFAATANASSAEVKDLADGFKMAAAVFASGGLKIEELTTMLGMMANAGIKGSDAGTSLKQMLLSLQAPTDKSKNLMEELGIKVYDAGGRMVDARKIISEFSTKLSGMTQEQRNAALATIFGSDAVRAANVVLMRGVDAYDQMYEAVNKTGAAAELAGARMKGLPGAVEAMNSSIETAKLALGTALAPVIILAAEKIADMANAFVKLPEPVQTVVALFGSVAAAVGPVVLVIGQMASAIGALQGAFASGGTFSSFSSALNGVGSSAMGATTALGSLAGITAAIGIATWGILEAVKAYEKAQAAANRETEIAAITYKRLEGNLEGSYAVLKRYRENTRPILEFWLGQRKSAEETAKAIAKASSSYAEFSRAVQDANLASAGGMGVMEETHEQATKRIWEMVEAERALAQAQATAVANQSGYAAMIQQYKEANITLTNTRAVFEEATKAANEFVSSSIHGVQETERASKALSESLKSQLDLIENINAKNEQYEERAKKLAQERSELEKERARLIAQGYTTASDKLQELDEKLAKNSEAARLNAEEHEKAGKKIVYSLVEQMLAADGLTRKEMEALTRLGVQWGLYSQKAVDEAQKVIREAQNITNQINTIPENKTTTITANATQAIGAIDTVKQKINTLYDKIVKITVQQYNEALGSSNSGYNKRASGGSVIAGLPYIVGERGPELFIPKNSGTIVPNDKLPTEKRITINLGGITINGSADSKMVEKAAYNGLILAARAVGI